MHADCTESARVRLTVSGDSAPALEHGQVSGMRFAPCMESTCDVHRRVTLPIPKSRFHWASPFSEDLGGVPTPETVDAQRNSAVGPRLGPRALLPKRARLRGENQRTSRLQIARSGDRPPNLWHAPRQIWRIRCRRQTCVRARKQQLVAAPLLSRAHGMCSGNFCHMAGLLHGDSWVAARGTQSGSFHPSQKSTFLLESRSGRSPHARASVPRRAPQAPWWAPPASWWARSRHRHPHICNGQ